MWLAPQYTERISGLQIAQWVQNGGIYVQCNLRGGSEYGPSWHEDGMMLNKRHCYEDFIGVAEEILRQGWTRQQKLAICGCSNGGLLMSALVAGLTVGGKAIGKSVAVKSCTQIVHTVGRVIHGVNRFTKKKK